MLIVKVASMIRRMDVKVVSSVSFFAESVIDVRFFELALLMHRVCMSHYCRENLVHTLSTGKLRSYRKVDSAVLLYSFLCSMAASLTRTERLVIILLPFSYRISSPVCPVRSAAYSQPLPGPH